ncbi:MAG: 4'-phosphopantetheinyl transferase superfamily protein [Proteobacteria bacterium]|nr:4'-phosphopantetheinyl transferase superfamily protein [Pseudomonadota bacterium]MBU1739496.1 4'-phosphopantetheinyl transferase superfamily protein [Pseudomonadota bacterium]
MTSAPIQGLPLPLSPSELGTIIGLKSTPFVTLVSLSDLQHQLGDKTLDPALFLTETELEKYRSYSYPKRRVEWLGGRIAVKRAAIELLNDRQASDYLDWQITPDPDGRPFLTRVDDHVKPAVEISLSHSHELSVGLAVFEVPCGIDIQKTSPAVIRVREKFCTGREKTICETLAVNNEEMQLTLLWSAKEALRKARGGSPLTGFLEMELVSLANPEVDCWTFSFRIRKTADQPIHRVAVFIYQDYGCSVALG